MNFGEISDHIPEAVERLESRGIIDFEDDVVICDDKELERLFSIPDHLIKKQYKLGNIKKVIKEELDPALNDLINLQTHIPFISFAEDVLNPVFNILLAKLISLGLSKEVATDYLGSILLTYGAAFDRCVYGEDDKNEAFELLKKLGFILENKTKKS